jgi:hypothetical protein
MLLVFVYWECCRLCIRKDVVFCVLGIELLFVYWECCCYLGSGNDVVISILGMLLLFG